jgi:hypothetical protein
MSLAQLDLFAEPVVPAAEPLPLPPTTHPPLALVPAVPPPPPDLEPETVGTDPPEEAEGQLGLFGDLDAPWKLEWNGMPEYLAEDLKPFRTLLVHFTSQLDVDAFTTMLGQQITPLTKFLWYPEEGIVWAKDKRYG